MPLLILSNMLVMRILKEKPNISLMGLNEKRRDGIHPDARQESTDTVPTYTMF